MRCHACRAGGCRFSQGEPRLCRLCVCPSPPLPLQEPGKRLGSKAGADEIKRHPWFAGINWALVRQQAPPFVTPRRSSVGGEPGPSQAEALLGCTPAAALLVLLGELPPCPPPLVSWNRLPLAVAPSI